MERAIDAFTQGNRIKIIQFEGAGRTNAMVCVWLKDAPAMRKFAAFLFDAERDNSSLRNQQVRASSQ
jgi:hypothetical protein